MDHGQAKPGALAERLGGEEGVHRPRQHVRAHALAGIGDGEGDDVRLAAALGLQRRLDGQVPARRHGIPGIQGEVEDRIFQLVGVGPGQRQIGREAQRHGDALAQRAGEHVLHGDQRRVHVHRLHLQGLAAAKGEEALGEARGPLGGGQRQFHIAVRLGDAPGGDAGAQQFQRAHDAGEHIVEVVGDAAGQLAHRFHLLRLEQGLAGLFQRQLGIAPLGDVAGDLGIADEGAILVVDSIQQHGGEEALAILADAPAFLLILAGERGGGERPVRLAGGHVLRREELGIGGADDFGAGIALDALGPRIPGADPAVGVEHEDGTIPHPLEEDAPLRLGSQSGEGALRVQLGLGGDRPAAHS